jgi:hypothetical protein
MHTYFEVVDDDDYDNKTISRSILFVCPLKVVDGLYWFVAYAEGLTIPKRSRVTAVNLCVVFPSATVNQRHI